MLKRIRAVVRIRETITQRRIYLDFSIRLATLGVFLVGSIAFSAPVVDLSKGESQVGYTYYSLDSKFENVNDSSGGQY